jgi:hypothetical protein
VYWIPASAGTTAGVRAGNENNDPLPSHSTQDSGPKCRLIC